MFRLLVSNTLVSLSIAFELFGPGICVLTIGPLGSPLKSVFEEDGSLEEDGGATLSLEGVELEAEDEVGATAAAVAYRRDCRVLLKVLRVGAWRLTDLMKEVMVVELCKLSVSCSWAVRGAAKISLLKTKSAN
jgi:hypothetical protein